MKTKLLYALLFGLVLLAIAQVVSAEDVLLEGTINGFSIWDGDEFIGQAPITVDKSRLENLRFLQYTRTDEIFIARLLLNQTNIGDRLAIPFYPRDDEMNDYFFELEPALQVFFDIENKLPNHVETVMASFRQFFNLEEYQLRHAKISRDKKTLLLPFKSTELNKGIRIVLLRIGEDESPIQLEISENGKDHFLIPHPETDILFSPDSRWLFFHTTLRGGREKKIYFFDLWEEYGLQSFPSAKAGTSFACKWDSGDPIVFCDVDGSVEKYQFDNGQWSAFTLISFDEDWANERRLFPMKKNVLVSINDKLTLIDKWTSARVRELEGSFVLYADENGERVITTDKLFFDTIHLYDFLNGLERHLLAEDLGQYFGTTYGEWNRFFPSGDYGMKFSRAFFDFLYDYPYEVFRFRDFASGITGESKKFIDSKILYGCEFHVINEFFVIECGVQPFNPIIMRSYGKVDYYHNYEELTEADLNRNKPFAPLLRKVISEKKIKRATRLDIYLIPKAKKSPDDSLLSILIRVGSIGLGGAVVAGTFFILFRSRRKI